MIDTSALVAGLIVDHEHHGLARSHLRADMRVPAIVIAETFAQLRRTFAQPAAVAATLLRPWTSRAEAILPTSSTVVTELFDRAIELDLGGNVHDALIAQTCLEQGVSLVTLDGPQHRLALALGTSSTYLLAPNG